MNTQWYTLWYDEKSQFHKGLTNKAYNNELIFLPLTDNVWFYSPGFRVFEKLNNSGFPNLYSTIESTMYNLTRVSDMDGKFS